MTELRARLLGLLADGAFHSGAVLGRELGCSRAAVWKQIGVLRTLGLELESSRGQGYRLRQPLDLLDRGQVASLLDPATHRALAALDLRFTVDSTSSRLLAAPAPAADEMLACAAEYQTGGRGRRGRRWLSPLGSGICLSVSWRFDSAPRDLSALGLAVGVASLEALEAEGARGVALKWPNDLVADGGKLGGILVDVVGESGGPLKVVAGLGINVRLPSGLAGEVRAEAGVMPPKALADVVPGRAVSRNRLLARLLGALHATLRQFGQDGFGPFADRWRRHDFLHGRPVTVTGAGGPAAGIARGIAADGALLVESAGGLATVYAGDVTLREAHEAAG